MEKENPEFYKWAFFNIRTVVFMLFILYLAIQSYTLFGFFLILFSYLAGYTIASYAIYYFKFVTKNL